MRKTRIGLISVCLLLICAMSVNLTGCAGKDPEMDLMEDITPNEVNALDDLASQNAGVTDFAVRLFQASEESGKNTLISPLSVLCALAMTANGAENETLEQMETVLGMTTQELNQYLYSYMQSLPKDEKYKLSLANSIWFDKDENFIMNQNFLQTNADYYGADLYEEPFNDQTCKKINDWVNENTDEMIPEILDDLPADAVMYLINALAFDAEWAELYKQDQVSEGTFTKEDGTIQDVEFMYSTEGTYLEDEQATGFIKYYEGGKYAFVAMLPNEGVGVSEYIASLDGAALNALLETPQYTTVYTSIPKFEVEYDVEMSEILTNMGMPKAFQENEAEFEGIGTLPDGNLYIGQVLHKTFIAVEEKGTRAGAVTAVSIVTDSVVQEPNEVRLDRPFVYMLIDCENNIPFFIGTMMDME